MTEKTKIEKLEAADKAFTEWQECQDYDLQAQLGERFVSEFENEIHLAFTHHLQTLKSGVDLHDLKDAVFRLEEENERLREGLRYVWKTVERAKWNIEVFGTHETAINNLAFYPDAPWNCKDGFWDWDTSHKSYDGEIKAFAATTPPVDGVLIPMPNYANANNAAWTLSESMAQHGQLSGPHWNHLKPCLIDAIKKYIEENAYKPKDQ